MKFKKMFLAFLLLITLGANTSVIHADTLSEDALEITPYSRVVFIFDTYPPKKYKNYTLIHVRKANDHKYYGYYIS